MASRRLVACLVLVALAVPSASATGWLVNVNGSGVGINPLGGRGDFVDLGVASKECSDEDDVVDVGVGNLEGDSSLCGGGPCTQQEGTFFNPAIDALYKSQLAGVGVVFRPGAGDCSDDGDVADVGIRNGEGRFGSCPGQNGVHGDARDGADVGVANREDCDDADGADVGAANCEQSDRFDVYDVGVLNHERVEDYGDVLDVSVLSEESVDGPDGNGIGLAATPPPIC
ncbi:MAG TPA: hypothetical protein VI997_09710 [Candidatus Thermoplasmatota archaeon]|nr:hypothetical protein [Candidatus Thermoplasmatota archaeon]